MKDLNEIIVKGRVMRQNIFKQFVFLASAVLLVSGSLRADEKVAKIQVTSELKSAVTNPDASVTYTIQASITNLSGKKITDMTYVDEFLRLYNVTLGSVSAVTLKPASPLPSLEDKISAFIYDFYPVADGNDSSFSLLSPRSSLNPGKTGTLTYAFTYFPLEDTPSIALTNHAKVTAVAECGKKFFADFSLSLGASPVAPVQETRIAIVGGGLAGLTAADSLAQAGLKPIVYEGSSRIGGRCFSGAFPNGQVFEHGGEFIDTWQTDIQDLVAELGLTLDNLVEGETAGTKPTSQVIDYDTVPPSFVEYTNEETANDYFNTVNPETGLTIFQQVVEEANNTYPTNDPIPGPATPWPLTYADPELAAELDSMTLDEYINNLTAFLRPDGNGSKTKLAQYLKVAYVGEFGAEPDRQSPFNLIYLLGFQELPEGVEPPNVPANLFQPFGISDELFHVQGGSSKIVLRLVEELQKMQITIKKNVRLTKVTFVGGPYQLQFSTGQGTITPSNYDHIILALPFSTIREEFSPEGFPLYKGQHVDISEANFSDLKKYAIQNLDIGRIAKLTVQFRNRYWRDLGLTGTSYATSNPYLNGEIGLEKLYQNSWEVTRAQSGKTGVLVDYTAGNKTEEVRTSYTMKDIDERNNYLRQSTCKFLKQLNFLFPVATSRENFKFVFGEPQPFFLNKHFNHSFSPKSSCSSGDEAILNAISDNWTESPWQRGAFSYWQPGQYIAGDGEIIDGVVTPPGAIVPFAGYEGVPEPYNPEQTGTCHFAGEHTTYDNQGFMNGAVQTGGRAAGEILNALATAKVKAKDKIKGKISKQ
jgi:monoamine oxidase